MSAASEDRLAMRIDPLRERLAAPELATARSALERGGLAAVVELAAKAIGNAEARRARFEMLSRDLDRHPEERDALLEAYLRETVKERRAFRADLRATKRRKEWKLDLAALAERVARANADDERAAEAALALAKKSADQSPPKEIDLAAIIELARVPGQWSRRSEALALLATLGRTTLPLKDAIVEVANALAVRTEHRWVQPAAIAALASVDPVAALALARQRLSSPDAGDDFLVRERIVELAARSVLGGDAWGTLVELACADASEHVRITVARADRDSTRLARMATADASAKVRATALISLAQRDVVTAEPRLIGALDNDPIGLVVQTAAEELASLARRGRTREAREVVAALSRAERRNELESKVRARVADMLLDVVVFSDIVLRAAHDALAPIVAATPVSGRTELFDPLIGSLDDAQLGRVLAVLAREDFALGVDRIESEKGRGLILHRGETRGVTSWRVLHEILHPSPSKRQAFPHTWGRSPGGSLRAPPGGLAELTATRVPGERVLSAHAGDWGRQLPLVDDLLSTGVVRGRPVTLVGSAGTTTVTPPRGLLARMKAWSTLSFRYAQLSELRNRSLDSDEASTQNSFVNEIARTTGVTVRFAPHAFTSGELRVATSAPRGLSTRSVTSIVPPLPSTHKQADAPPASLSALAPAALAPLVDRLGGLKDTWHDLVTYAQSPHGNRLPHLAAYAFVMLGAMMARGVFIRRSIDHDRDAIPLVIGGWGTRGKSGTERLKAALFQGLGHECLVKTTGCEAMFIHAVPGTVAREVFIYRPYDKATVWEQRDVLQLARQFRVRVFLWECMALQPDLVNLLQSQWMRDDYSTITNAYPDHEDVQGPSGYDVANVISEFVPTNGNLITSEEQMLPLLRERAKERESKLRVVAPRDADLLADDLLARFPYQEHPRNIALVTSLARALGIPAAVAIAEMADHVVPDLGVLKTYPDVPYRDRLLSFINGMSANERTGALSNWIRAGLDRHDPEKTPGDWVVTLVNNRGDRVARSEVFARFLVEDAPAHRHVLIGTNVGGLRGFIKTALEHHLISISPTHDLDGDGTARLHTARARVDAAFARLKIVSTEVSSVKAELAALGAPSLGNDVIASLLEPGEPGESFDRARSAVESALPATIEGELRPFVVSTLARRRTVRGVHALVSRDLGSNPIAVDRAFAAAYKAIFEESIVALDDPTLDGDQILDAIAIHVPPKARAIIMGVQNIKGTGLDFVYRWVSIETVHRYLDQLRSPRSEVREEALGALLVHGDFGLLDAKNALAFVEAAEAREDAGSELAYEPVIARLKEIVEQRSRRLKSRRSKSFAEQARGFFGRTFDYLDATRRRRMAGELLDALVLGRISHAGAAKRMREIVARAKGGWALSGAT